MTSSKKKSWLRRLLLAAGVLVLLLLLAVAWGAWWLRSGGLPVRDGEARLAGLGAAVEVRWDRWGVPYVRAGNEADLARALGYLHANDRFTQMEFGRRLATGRLAELVGRAAFPGDRYYRQYQFRQTAERLWDQLEPSSRQWLEAYAAGINAWLAARDGDLPPGLRLLGAQPEAWQPTDSLHFFFLIAHNLSFNLGRHEEIRYVLLSRMGEERVRDLVGEPDLHIAPAILEMAAAAERARADSAPPASEAEASTGLSNNWALGTSRSATGSPLVASDPHLALQLPPTWFEAHLRAPGFEVRGMTLPGTPIVVFGQNASLAWALTNAMLDDHDFYLEILDESGEKVKRGDRWVPLAGEDEEVRLRDGSVETIRSRSTDRGPLLVSDWKGAIPARSLAWTIYEPGDPFSAFLEIARARTLEAVRLGIGRYNGPAQNLVVAHRDGGLLATVLGRTPERKLGSGRMPSPGWDPAYGWNGLRPAADNPTILDPEEDFLATANNDVRPSGYDLPWTAEFETPHRVDRIRQVIAGRQRFTPAEVAASQLDETSLYSRRIVELMAGDYEGDAGLAWRALETWDGEMGERGVAALFSLVRHGLVVAIFRDEEKTFGVDFLSYFGSDAHVLRALDGRLDPSWLDDLTTPEREGKAEIFARVLAEAWQSGRERWGDDVAQWRWDELHPMTLRHPMGSVPGLGGFWNRGPFPVAGSRSTISAYGGYRLRGGVIPAAFGPSVRAVFDTGDGDGSLVILPGGQSGHPADPHYDDQLELFLRGETRPAPWSEATIERATVSTLRLVP